MGYHIPLQAYRFSNKQVGNKLNVELLKGDMSKWYLNQFYIEQLKMSGNSRSTIATKISLSVT